jgi:cell wall-associated NlpC family hydrolase
MGPTQHPKRIRFGATAAVPLTSGMPPGELVTAPIRINPRSPRQALRPNRGSALFVIALGLSLALPGAATAQQSFPRLREFLHSESTPAPRSGDAQRDSLVALARKQIGVRYSLGGTSPDRGFDCSGFLQYLMRGLDVRLPRTAAEQARAGEEVPRDLSRLLPGDILTFGRGGRVTHVGVYVGGGRFIHASTGSRRIIEARLDRSENSLVRAWSGVRRMLARPDSSAVVAKR